MKSNYKQLRNYIQLVDQRNRDLSITNLLGVSIGKKFIPSIANTVGTDLSSYQTVRFYRKPSCSIIHGVCK